MHWFIRWYAAMVTIEFYNMVHMLWFLKIYFPIKIKIQ